MIIAIYGKSCAGKSSVARELGKLINAPVRFCSEEVKMRAKQLGCTPMALSLEQHISIDEDTREIAGASDKDIVIEGCFLPYVLSNLSDVFWVKLTCNQRNREKRYLDRNPEFKSDIDLTRRDYNDEVLCKKIYGESNENLCGSFTIDTSNCSVEEIVLLIKKELQNLNGNEA